MYFRNDRDKAIFNHIYTKNIYQFPENGKEKIVVDVGAHIGSATLAAVERGFKVYAFEPFVQSFELLKKNTENLDVIAKNVGIGNPVGFRNLYIHSNSSSNTVIGKTEDFVKVEIISLKNALLPVAHCDILKLDCEGAEFEIVDEIVNELYKKIDTIVVEIHYDYGNKENFIKKLTLRYPNVECIETDTYRFTK